MLNSVGERTPPCGTPVLRSRFTAVLVIQLFLLASFLALINLAFTCFSGVLYSDGGTDSAVFSSLCSLSRSLFQYGLYSFLAPFGIASFAACRIHLVNSLTTLLISLSYMCIFLVNTLAMMRQ